MSAKGVTYSETGGRSRGLQEFTVMSMNIWTGLGAAGSDKRNALYRIIQRVQPDVLALQECGATGSHITTDMVADMGFSEAYYPTVGTYEPAILSRYASLGNDVVDSTLPADEMFAEFPNMILDMGGGKKLLVMSIHNRIFCLAGPCDDNQNTDWEFAKAVEWFRIKKFLEAARTANPGLEVVVMGDCNGDPAMSQTASFPSAVSFTGFVPGTDLTSEPGYPILFSEYPQRQLEDCGLFRVGMENQDGNDSTLWTTTPNAALTSEFAIDIIAVSSGLGKISSEIIDSEATQTGGAFDKKGPVLPSGDSRETDHKPVVARLRFRA